MFCEARVVPLCGFPVRARATAAALGRVAGGARGGRIGVASRGAGAQRSARRRRAGAEVTAHCARSVPSPPSGVSSAGTPCATPGGGDSDRREFESISSNMIFSPRAHDTRARRPHAHDAGPDRPPTMSVVHFMWGGAERDHTALGGHTHAGRAPGKYPAPPPLPPGDDGTGRQIHASRSRRHTRTRHDTHTRHTRHKEGGHARRRTPSVCCPG